MCIVKKVTTIADCEGGATSPYDETDSWGTFNTERQAYLFAVLNQFNENEKIFTELADSGISKLADIKSLSDEVLHERFDDWNDHSREDAEADSADQYVTWKIEHVDPLALQAI